MRNNAAISTQEKFGRRILLVLMVVIGVPIILAKEIWVEVLCGFKIVWLHMLEELDSAIKLWNDPRTKDER